MPHNGEWKVAQAKFQGYVESSLENIDKKMCKHDDHFEKIYDRLEKQGQYIERLKVKVAIGAAIVGSIFALVISNIQRMKFW